MNSNQLPKEPSSFRVRMYLTILIYPTVQLDLAILVDFKIRVGLTILIDITHLVDLRVRMTKCLSEMHVAGLA